MSRIAIKVGHIVIANEVTFAELDIAFSAIHDVIGARVQDSMDEGTSASDTAGDEPRVHLPLGVALADCREDLEQDVVEQIGGPLL